MPKLAFVLLFLACALGGAKLRTVVEVDGARAVVDQPIAGLSSHTELVLGVDEALAGCASWDIKDNCCPAGCAAKNGTNWSKADSILQGCMRGLGCSESDVKGATVFMKCDCKKK
jgi:hypothetical protein